MAIDWRALAKDKRLWAVAGVGGAAGLGVAAYRKRRGAGAAPAGTGDGAAGTSLPYVSAQPSVYDSSLQDIYEGFNQTALDLQSQINDIGSQLDQTAPPSPSNPAPVAKRAAKRYVTTRKLGGAGGHPVSYDYLAKLGLLRKVGGRYVTTGKFGTSVGHPVSYQYLAQTGYLRSA